jgi:hypothetical protein
VNWVVEEGKVTLQIFEGSFTVGAKPYIKATASASGVKFELPMGEDKVQAEYYAKIYELLKALQISSVDGLSVPLESGAKRLVLLANAHA